MSYSESRDESFRLGEAPFFNAVLLDGRLVGHWKPTAKPDSVLIEAVLNRYTDVRRRKPCMPRSTRVPNSSEGRSRWLPFISNHLQAGD